MNRNKFLILVLVIAAAFSLIAVTKKRPTANNLKAPSLLNPKKKLSPMIVSSDKASSNIQEKISIKNEVITSEFDEEYPDYEAFWLEINEKWNEDLKNFIISISPNDGARMFHAYVEAHKRYLKEQDRIVRKYQKLNAIKPLSEKQHDQFGAETSKNSKKANEVNKKIFGQHYSDVKNFHKEFEESIQVYSRDKPIFFDLNFNK